MDNTPYTVVVLNAAILILLCSGLAVAHLSSPAKPSLPQAAASTARRLQQVACSLVFGVSIVLGFIGAGMDGDTCTVNTPGRPCNPMTGFALLQWLTGWMTLLSCWFYALRAAFPTQFFGLRVLWEVVVLVTPVVSAGGCALYAYAALFVTSVEDPRRTGERFFLSPAAVIAHTLNTATLVVECRGADALPLRGLLDGGGGGVCFVTLYLLYEWFVYFPSTNSVHYFFVDTNTPLLTTCYVQGLLVASTAAYSFTAQRFPYPNPNATPPASKRE